MAFLIWLGCFCNSVTKIVICFNSRLLASFYLHINIICLNFPLRKYCRAIFVFSSGLFFCFLGLIACYLPCKSG